MRVIFMGSAELSCPTLKALIDSSTVEVCAVVSQPDRAQGRGRKKLASCATKQMAVDMGIDCVTPENVNDPDVVKCLAGYEPDAIIVIAYGQILRKDILSMPSKGCINIHASLLPKYRGAAPIQWAVANGETVTGVTTMLMDAGMDTGAMLLKKEVVIGPEDTAGLLHDKLASAGADALMETLAGMADNTVVVTEQDDSEATLAPKLTKADGNIDWKMSAKQISDRVRGFNPWPICWSKLDVDNLSMGTGEGKLLKVWKAVVVEGSGCPGELIEDTEGGLVVAAGEKALRLIEVQPEGGKIMAGADYARGHIHRK